MNAVEEHDVARDLTDHAALLALVLAGVCLGLAFGTGDLEPLASSLLFLAAAFAFRGASRW